MNIPPPQHYKLRAECHVDTLRFLRRMSIACIKEHRRIWSFILVQDVGFPDCEVKFTTSLSLERLRDILAGIVDGHVMLETVELLEDYTGERKYVDIYEARVGKPFCHPDEVMPEEIIY